MTISEMLRRKASAIRSKPCPAGHCEKCYGHHCRALLTGCCVCTGHITLSMKNFYPNK